MSATAERDPDETATGILEEVLRIAKHDEDEGGSAGKGRFAVGDVIEAFGERAFGPFLIVLPMIEMTPVGSIPGVPSFLALMIGLVAVQLAFGRDCLWLPGFVERRSVKAKRVTDGAPKLRKVTNWIDRHTGERWHHLVGSAGTRAGAVCIVVLCLCVPPLEIVPFASTAPMAAILAFGVALLARDGRLMALAFALSALAIGVVGWVVFAKLLGG
jgi:hypothetical protein